MVDLTAATDDSGPGQTAWDDKEWGADHVDENQPDGADLQPQWVVANL